jgi:hypothetical protein
LLFQSETLTGGDAALPVEVDVSGVGQLSLVLSEDGSNSDDHADWAEASVVCSDSPLEVCEPQNAPITPPEGHDLVWSDEFDSEGAPSSENWSYEEGFLRNEELQWYQPDNAWVQAGFLIIEVK